MGKKTAQPLDAPPDGLAARLETEIRAAGALALGRLARGLRLSPHGTALLHEQLAQRGFERTGKAMRVPLGQQLDAALAGGELIPVARLGPRVKGAMKGELARAVARHVAEGRAHLVVHHGRRHLAPPGAAVLERDELAAVAGAMGAVAALLRATRARGAAPGRRVLRADVAAAIARLAATVAARPPAGPDAQAVLASAIAQFAPSGEELVPVPRLVQALVPPLSVETARAALLDAHRAGVIELRPHSSLDPLSAADEALCPRGFNGAPLSYARRTLGAATGAP